MKCDRCKYLYTPTFENETESYCTMFSDDSADLTDDGCRFNMKTLDKKHREFEEYCRRLWEQEVEW